MQAYDYIKKHAQEIEHKIIKSHIDLYVNNFTLDIGEEGENAVNTLFGIARAKGIMPKSNFPLFIE